MPEKRPKTIEEIRAEIDAKLAADIQQILQMSAEHQVMVEKGLVQSFLTARGILSTSYTYEGQHNPGVSEEFSVIRLDFGNNTQTANSAEALLPYLASILQDQAKAIQDTTVQIERSGNIITLTISSISKLPSLRRGNT